MSLARTPPTEMVSPMYPSGRLGAVTRITNEISKYWELPGGCDPRDVEILINNLSEKIHVFVEACDQQAQREDIQQDKMDAFLEWYDQKRAHMNNFLREAKKWLNGNIQAEEAQSLIKQGESASVIGGKSAASRNSKTGSLRSTTSSARVKLAEKKAKLLADQQHNEQLTVLEEQRILMERQRDNEQLELQRQRENEQREYQRKKDDLKIQQRQQELELIEESLDAMEDRDKVSQTQRIDEGLVLTEKRTFNYPMSGDSPWDRVSNTKLPPLKKEDRAQDKDSSQLVQILSEQNRISRTLIQNQEASFLPRHEPVVFTGQDITLFKTFVCSFKTMIEDRCQNDADKFYYLEKYTTGHPQQLVRSCNNGQPQEAYQSAMKLLQEQYGNEYAIAQTYIQKLDSWPIIKGEDPKSLQELAVFLTSCKNTMKDMSALTQLNSISEIMKIIKKLPFDMRKSFRSTMSSRIQSGELINFEHLEKFVSKQSFMLNLPVIGDIKDGFEKRPKNATLDKKKSFATTAAIIQDKPSNSTIPRSSYLTTPCPCCRKTNHALNECLFFKKKSNDEKVFFLRKHDLCFGCLKSGHRSRSCRNRLTCNICNKSHPSSLHREEFKRNEKASSEATDHTSSSFTSQINQKSAPSSEEQLENGMVCTVKICQSRTFTGADDSSRVLCAAVPVKVRIRGSKDFVITYLGLDGFATECFMDQTLLRRLGVSGTKTNINITTMENRNNEVATEIINNLEIFSLDSSEKCLIPRIYAQKIWPFKLEDSPRRSDVESADHLRGIPFNFVKEKIGILAGINTPHILKPLEIVSGDPDDVFASRHLFGWAINGPVNTGKRAKTTCHYVRTVNENHDIEMKIDKMYSQDFEDNNINEKGESFEDGLWLEKVKSSIHKRPDGHYEIDLPFRKNIVQMPCNFRQVHGRLLSLKKRFCGNPVFFDEYKTFMDMMIQKGYMDKVPPDEINSVPGKVWFLTHHGVFHKQKKKIRVVFDCSLRNAGVSLNDELLQGPDLTNNLMGVLLRFRQYRFAFMGDVEKMFFQVKVPTSHADFMRILWFPNGELNKEPIQYRITSHIFGAVSSPSCANYALKQSAMENPQFYSKEAKESILKDFYVDDLLKSMEIEEAAVILLEEIRLVLMQGGFNLTGFVSNSRKILSSLPHETLAKDFKILDLDHDELPHERALGVGWAVEDDTIRFKINVTEHDVTKRGLLSVIFSLYDPLGIVGPTIVPAKLIFQEACRLKLSWDEKLPEELVDQWKKWKEDITLLEQYSVPRCLKLSMNEIVSAQLHVFCDGSIKAYGAVAYARFVEAEGGIFCSLIMAKSRLTPMGNKTLKTIPRIELNAARMAVNVVQILRRELTIPFEKEYFWSDSMTVLRYINNDTARFQRFVANRVAFIRSHTKTDEWHFINGEENIADLISRGTSVPNFIQNKIWKKGPQFLWIPESNWSAAPEIETASDGDLEIKTKNFALSTFIEDDSATNRLLNSSSDWFKTLYRIAAMLRLKKGLKTGVWTKASFSLVELLEAECAVWRYIQGKYYAAQILIIRKSKMLKRGDPLEKLSPHIDAHGILRVGGRLGKSMESVDTKHPIILPNKPYVVTLLMWQCHKTSGHMGRHYMLSELREKYWIIGANTLARKITRRCIGCRKKHSRIGEQVMAELPVERVIGDHPPFQHTGIDFFGPIMITRGRSKANEKRYGVVFTCLTSRAIHLEVAHSLETTSFIDALRRFFARRGQVRSIHSDNGTNLVGGCRELKEAINEWNKEPLHLWLQQKHIEWKFNPPSASHFGGIWEREIRSVRKILSALIDDRPKLLDDESLRTLMCEVESILNSRPLTPLSDDPKDLRPLTPNHLLLLHSQTPLPPGIFNCDDTYSRRRWKQVQYLADVFWTRWRKEYLRLLQERQKWTRQRRSHQVGDLVLVVDQLLPRSQWCVGRIVEVKKDNHGNVRVAKVKISRCRSGRDLNVATTELERPIVKLVLLMSANEYN